MKILLLTFLISFSAINVFSQNLGIETNLEKKDTNSFFYNNQTSQQFIKKFYYYENIEQYLDNYSEFITYQIETAGDISSPDAMIFSIHGNSYKWNKYYFDNFRINDLFFSGNSLYKPSFINSNIEIDKLSSSLIYSSNFLDSNFISLQLNRSGFGGTAPFSEDLIHLYHRTAREAVYKPINEQRKVNLATNINSNFQIKFKEKYYNQSLIINSGQRTIPDFDYSGIKEFYPENYINIQSIGEIPLITKFFDSNKYLFSFQNRDRLFSEQYYGKEETAKYNNLNFSLFGNKKTSVSEFTSGFNFSLKEIKHQNPNFYRNIIDQDGEAFEPWYTDAQILELSIPVCYSKEIIKNTSFIADLYNGIIQNNPNIKNTFNPVYLEAIEQSFIPLYVNEWQSESFTSGLIENSIGLKNKVDLLNKAMIISSSVDFTLDGFIVKDKSKVSTNYQFNIELYTRPLKFFEIAVNIGRKRIAYNYDLIKYISNDYLNGQTYYWNDYNGNQLYEENEKSELFTNSGGKYHHLDKSLKQSAYIYLEIPLKIKIGKKCSFEIFPFYKKYNNLWLTQYELSESMIGHYETNGETNFFFLNNSEINYLIIPFYTDYMQTNSNSRFENSPFTKGYTLRFQKMSNKFFFSASWTAYMVVGYSGLGNGLTHNNLNVYSESLANPNTKVHNTGRLDSDKSYVGRMLISYNFSNNFSTSFQLKYKDGQPFSFFVYSVKQDSIGNQVAIQNEKPKGDNPLNMVIGPREDAFFNTELRLVYNTKIAKKDVSFNLTIYNIYDFGTELAEYTFSPAKDNRYALELNIPRGIIFSIKYNF